ncbi:MAG: hypothetical protein KatS3mg003_0255 [Candidatus Nitrosocaldaceae archaeon]|nr:MAG: hypothetical protein KatS3mg003_0255 [Candidatus Nitrosocaldaceae archaeon]
MSRPIRLLIGISTSVIIIATAIAIAIPVANNVVFANY